MIDPSHGKPFKELGVKSGDWVRLVADCAMHGVEIQVPRPNVLNVKCNGSAFAYCEDRGDGPIAGVAGWCHGSADRWIQVFRG